METWSFVDLVTIEQTNLGQKASIGKTKKRVYVLADMAGELEVRYMPFWE